MRVDVWPFCEESRVPSSLAADLSEHVVAAIEEGASRREAAWHFELRAASAVRWHEAVVKESCTLAKAMGGDQRSPAIEVQAHLIPRTYEAKPNLFLHASRAR